MVYPALLPLMRTPRLPVVDRTDAPADLNGLDRFAGRRNLVSARVPSHLKRNLSILEFPSYVDERHDILSETVLAPSQHKIWIKQKHRQNPIQ